MDKKITQKEEERATQIKTEFAEVHTQIANIQEEMNLLNKKAEELIHSLELLRKDELDFLNSLNEKYGEGSLDPFKMIYKITEKNERKEQING